MPARDIVIEGSYKINSYTVTYKVDGEQYGETETYEYGAAVTLREKPSGKATHSRAGVMRTDLRCRLEMS